ncbi:MAG: cell cycle transcriptional regulator TrcR [Hyphomicrobiaceae bacterium]
MSDRKPLMPKATAVWLVENTSLTFDQIAELCGLHNLEVKGIADGDVAQGIKGQDPISSGQLTREEIARAETNPSYRLRLAEPKYEMPVIKSKKGPRYTPVSRRHDRPNAVLWLQRNHPELKDSQIMRLVGTTKPTIAAIRDRTHWNSANLQPQDPVTLGLCSQIDLDAEVKKASKRLPVGTAPAGAPESEPAGTLLPASQTIPGLGDQPGVEHFPAPQEEEAQSTDVDEDARVFAKLKELTRPSEENDEESSEKD